MNYFVTHPTEIYREYRQRLLLPGPFVIISIIINTFTTITKTTRKEISDAEKTEFNRFERLCMEKFLQKVGIFNPIGFKFVRKLRKNRRHLKQLRKIINRDSSVLK
jgi:hypothetical protein